MLPLRSIILAGIAAILAVLFVLLRQPDQQQPPPSPPPVAGPPTGPRQVVATRDIPRGTAIDRQNVALAIVDPPVDGGVSRLEDVLGRVALDTIRAQEVIRADRLTPFQDPGGLTPLIPRGHRAVTLRISDENGVGFYIRPGDRVDILLTARDEVAPRGEGRNVPRNMARYLMQDVLVLAVGDMLHVGRDGATPPRGAPAQRTMTLTVAVTPEQALLLSLAREDGGYAFALRPPLEREEVDAARVTRVDLLAPDPVPPRPIVRPAIEIIRGVSGDFRP